MTAGLAECLFCQKGQWPSLQVESLKSVGVSVIRLIPLDIQTLTQLRQCQ
jgi:hypothetical protein